jgi:hypothetical protein
MKFKVWPSTLLFDVLNVYCTRERIGDGVGIRLVHAGREIHAGRQLDVSTTVTLEGAGLKDLDELCLVLQLSGD